jgi:hypothetical protein
MMTSRPGIVAMMNHLMIRGINFVTIPEDKDAMSQYALHEAWELTDPALRETYEYGVDYVEYAWIPKGGPSLIAFMQNIAVAQPVDRYGNPTTSLPLMQRVNELADFRCIIETGEMTETPGVALRELGISPSVALPFMPIGEVGIKATPYTHIFGEGEGGRRPAYLAGPQAAAEYESILGKPGLGLRDMDPQTLYNLYIFIVIVVVNIAGISELLKKKATVVEETR